MKVRVRIRGEGKGVRWVRGVRGGKGLGWFSVRVRRLSER